jgi:uncharacterized protein YkwD
VSSALAHTLAAGASGDEGPPPPRDDATDELRRFELTLFDLTNEDRAQQGIAPLRFDDDLVQVARTRAASQRSATSMSHEDDSGVVFIRLLDERGISTLTAGEALVWVSGPVANLAVFAHDVLLQSAQHRALLLNPRFTYLAVGGASVGPGQYVFAEIFSDR